MAAERKKWILATLLAVLFPAIAVHVSCVAAIGPGSWGSGMEEKAPEFLPIESNAAVSRYIAEFEGAAADDRASPPDTTAGSLADSASSTDDAASSQDDNAISSTGATVEEFNSSLIQGKVFWTDPLPSENLTIIATHEGKAWVEQQHFYLWQQARDAAQPTGREKQQAPTGQEQAEAEKPKITEFGLDRGMILNRPTLMKRGGQTVVVIERWQPWALSPLGKLSRYLRSYADPTLRPENSLYLLWLPSGDVEYWGPGHTVKPSPDRRKAILLRSGAMLAGYYSMHLWDFEQDRLTTIVSLRESDPGSGRSFDYEWSRDSEAVHITGETGGFERRSPRARSLDLMYLVGENGLYDLPGS